MVHLAGPEPADMLFLQVPVVGGSPAGVGERGAEGAAPARHAWRSQVHGVSVQVGQGGDDGLLMQG